jgi:hypothetical protein
MMTPYDKLKSLPHAEKYLKPDITFKQLDAIAKKPTLTLGGSYKRLAPSCSIQSLVKLQRPHENHLHAATFQAHLWIGIYCKNGFSS